MVISDKKSDQKAKGNRGCLTGWGVFTLGATLFLLAIPSLVSIKEDPPETVVKHLLFGGVKECVFREAGNLSTDFADGDFFKNSYRRSPTSKKYLIKPSSDTELKDTCFGARAEPINTKDHTWFETNYKDGVFTRTCGDSTKPGCVNGRW